MLANTTYSVKSKISVSFAPEITAEVKTFKPIEIASDEALAHWITTRVWSPIIYKNEHRRKENFLSAAFLGFDVDDGLTLAQTIELVKEWQVFAMIGVTRNHQKPKGASPACDRFRIVFKASEPCLDLYQYEHNVRLYMNVLYSDRSCKDGARLFFPCKEIVFVNQGEPLDWQIAPPPPDYAAIQTRHHDEETVPLWVLRKVEDGVAPGNALRPGRHSACYAIGLELTELGYEVDEIVSYICTGPLAEIGVEDVRRQVEWGSDRAKKKQTSRGGRKDQAEREADSSPTI